MAADKAATERINSFQGTPFASNDYSKIYANLYELNGYKFVNLKIIGPVEVVTLDGCKAKFELQDGQFMEVDSDSTEINTDFSMTLGSGITEFEIDLGDELLDYINSKNISAISFSFKNSFVKFLIPDIAVLRSVVNEPIPKEEENTPEESTETE